MPQGHASLPWFALFAALVWTSYCQDDTAVSDIRTATACFSNVNHFLHLDCEDGKVIAVDKVIHGAKLKTERCKSPASAESYRKECCQPHPNDCSLHVTSAAETQCNNHQSCDPVATWSITNKRCDQDKYPPTTTYMLMAYTCVNLSTTRVTTPLTVPVTTAEPTTVPNKNTSTQKNAHAGQVKAASDDEELSDALIGAIVAGSLGMLLTFVVFIFYWGRKRRLRIVSKPQPTVWDYLLNQTFTVRGSRGYDQFPSVRSSASSDGEANSPQTAMRKNTWLPNISPTEADENDDVESMYENDNARSHRVEVHPNATPSPFAILNLDAYVDNNSTVRNTHQDV